MKISNNIINESLPYQQLEHVGISRQMADRLPEDVKSALLTGATTPLMQLNIKASNGVVVTIPARLQVVEGKDGQSMLMAYPARRDISQAASTALNLSDVEKSQLGKGNVVAKEIDGQKQYLQLDPVTKSVIRRDEKSVMINPVLANIEKIKDIQLGSQQKEQAKNGRPIELTLGDTKVSVGVDLKEPQGFKIMKGDLKEWERRQQIRYDVAHPEYVGLLQTDKNRWEYQKIVDRQSTERAIKLDGAKNEERREGGLRI